MMNSPRSPSQRWGIPVNLETGEPYTDGQLSRVDRLKEAAKALLDVMHESEGTDPGNAQFSTRHMSVAATHLEAAVMFAMKGATSVR
jgi:hypothetical protein